MGTSFNQAFREFLSWTASISSLLFLFLSVNVALNFAKKKAFSIQLYSICQTLNLSLRLQTLQALFIILTLVLFNWQQYDCLCTINKLLRRLISWLIIYKYHINTDAFFNFIHYMSNLLKWDGKKWQNGSLLYHLLKWNSFQGDYGKSK